MAGAGLLATREVKDIAPPVKWALEARGLTRDFGAHRAVDAVSFAMAPGELLAVFGPNGAGKSTLLKMLGGGLRPDAGEVWIRGTRAVDDPDRHQAMGILSHQGFLYDHLTARENLRFYGRLYGVPDPGPASAKGLERVGLRRWADARVEGFSRGMRQRLALARALLHDPDVVLLDEPYTGLDAHAAAMLNDVLRALRDGQRTVVLVTHNLSRGLELADRVAIQVRGAFAWAGRRADLEAVGFEAFYREVVDEARASEEVGAPARPGGDTHPAPGVAGDADASSPEKPPGEGSVTPDPGLAEPARTRAPSYVAQVGALLWKDLVVELRTRERVVSMAAFAVLVAVLFNYATDPTLVRFQDVAAGLIWLTVVFGGLLGIGRTFALEDEDGALLGVLMSPIPRDAIFFGKVLANVVLIAGVTLLVFGVFGLFFGLSFRGDTLALVTVVALGIVGFVGLGTLFSAISVRTTLGEALLPILVFPLLVPLVIYGGTATQRLLVGRPAAEVWAHARMLGAFALVALAVGGVLFRYVVEE